jgi:deoxyadenosine/deoxycytidine kinase
VLKSDLEERWRVSIRQTKRGLCPILSICGPSGVGKSTVVTALANSYPAFFETTKGNPYLNSLLTGNANFDAAANQEWFLKRIGRHISRASSRSPLILDQDPAAIVLAYSQMFLEDDKMTEEQYISLLERLLKIEEKLDDWRCPRTVLFLDAPADVLRQRILQRWGKWRTPRLKWFERVRNQFVKLFVCFPNAMAISTASLSPEQVIARAKSLIERRTEGSQA